MTATATIARVDLGPGVLAGFTDRGTGNVAHRRPHLPSELAATRRAVAREVGVEADHLHLMRQVHGADVATIDTDTPPGQEIRGVDGLVTGQRDRALVVQVADCVPVLVAVGDRAVAAIHVGRRGLRADVVDAALDVLGDVAGDLQGARAALGPAIGGCCYEVPADMQREVVATHRAAEATTTWGTPSLDLPSAVRVQLAERGVDVVWGPPGCTRCDPDGRWFSHRADPDAGRQAGVIALTGSDQ